MLFGIVVGWRQSNDPRKASPIITFYKLTGDLFPQLFPRFYALLLQKRLAQYLSSTLLLPSYHTWQDR